MEGSVRGLPLLSGPPPNREDINRNSCRRCLKEFNFFTRSGKQCNHCGFTYCSSCIDHQALMPRTGTAETGYDVVPVCAYCIDNLTVTAGGKSYLRALSVARLRNYLKAYGISVPPSTIEKEELVNLIVNSRGENGCLPPEKEEYYRKRSVPSPSSPDERPRRNLFERFGDAARQATTQTTAAPQPASAPRSRTVPPNAQRAPRPQTGGQPAARQPQARPRPPPPPGYNPHGDQPGSRPSSFPPPPQQPPFGQPYPGSQYRRPSFHAQPQRPTTQQAPPPRPPSPPIPSLDSLLSSSSEEISQLSVHTLKGILHQNHVNARLILEKADLVEKVRALVDAEKREREREAELRRLEEQEILERQRRNMEELRARREWEEHMREEHHRQEQGEHGGDIPAPTAGVPNTETSDATMLDGTQEPPRPSSAPTSMPPPPPKPPAFSALERNGLCIVCQDEEANIALVDCGHLALCMSCSELVMNSTRECPLCRTRIVTRERMLRIFKT